MPAPLVQHLLETFTAGQFREKFGETPAIVYGEGYGGKIQSGSYYHPTQTFIAFDVLVDGQWWLNWGNVCDVAAFFKVPTVPFVGDMPLSEAVDIVRNGFDSPLAKKQTGISHSAEGLVGRTVETLFDKRKHRMIVKLKTKDFKGKG